MQAGRAAGAVLGVGAAGELLLRLALEPGEAGRVGAVTGGATNVAVVVALLLLCLMATVPLMSGHWPASAVAICAASLISLTVFGMMPYAGGVALLIAAYLTGRHGPAWVAVGLGVPFLALALVSRGWPAELVAGLTPAVALAGCARLASGEAELTAAARSLSEEVLSENMARGERARIARELHDVVAHHISMVSVQISPWFPSRRRLRG